MNVLEEWLAEAGVLLGLDEGTGAAYRDLVLDLARDVAHGVARPAAPLTTFLLGLAAGQAAGQAAVPAAGRAGSDRAIQALVVERLAAQLSAAAVARGERVDPA